MQVAALYRHPIKSHGRESIEHTSLIAGQTMPWDRTWAVTHARSKFDATHPKWERCANFMIGVRTPGLAGIWARLDEAEGNITLTHQNLGDITLAPLDPESVARFLRWVTPLCPPERGVPTALVSAGARGMTDCAYPSVSVMNIASHDAVSQAAGGALEKERWRGNIWFDGAPAWAEMAWGGQRLRIGDVVLEIRDRIDRCAHTAANPYTGQRDRDVEGTLERAFSHRDFGMHAVVVTGGDVTVGDPVRLL
ncbi:MAG: MOSC domain-containing protein [Pseudomonadota bacterium]